MFGNLLKSGLSSLQSMSIKNVAQNSQPSKPSTASQGIKLQKIVEQTMLVLTSILNDKLGEEIEIQQQQMKQLTKEVMNSKHLEILLLQTKQKYNQLVNKSSGLYRQAKKISHSVAEFITNINMFLESEELLVPLNDIQRGVGELNAEKVEKQFGYLIKIFTNNFQEVIDRNVQMVQKSVGEEVRVLKGLNKNLENQILGLKGHKNNDQSKYLQQALRITSLSDKVNKMAVEKGQIQRQKKELSTNMNDKLKIISDLQNQLKKMKNKQVQFLQKIKMLELKSVRVQKNVKERSNEAQHLNKIIQKLKERQEQIVEEIQSQHKKKQRMYQSLQKKLCNEKGVLQQKLQNCDQKITALQLKVNQQIDKNGQLKRQLNKYKQSNFMQIDLDNIKNSNHSEPKEEGEARAEQMQHNDSKHKMTLQELMQKLNHLQIQNKQIQASLNKQKELGVNKQVLKGLFINYDDQSKEWHIRRNIKYQIYSLLDLKDKLPKPEQTKQNKWFGIF